MLFFNEYNVAGMFLAAIVFWLIVPERMRTRFIIAASFGLLATVQLGFTVFLVGLTLFAYVMARTLARQHKFRTLLTSLAVLVIVLFCFKYGHRLFVLLAGTETEFAKAYIVPLGLSYLVFKLIAFVLDAYRGEIDNPDYEELLAFILFIPSFPAGPIERYQNFAFGRIKKFDLDFFFNGIGRIGIGYFKKIVLVNFILHELVYTRLYSRVVADGVSMNLSFPFVLSFLVGSLIYAYVDLSSYADLAIGFGRLFGYRLCENMNYPIFQKNLSDYWNCWHISLSHWCRNNVYFPVLGRTRNNVMALYASFTVMGLWHYLSLNWILWGMWHATGITLYSKWNRFKIRKKLRGKVPARVGHALGALLTIVYSGMGFAFIMMETPSQAFRVLLAMVF